MSASRMTGRARKRNPEPRNGNRPALGSSTGSRWRQTSPDRTDPSRPAGSRIPRAERFGDAQRPISGPFHWAQGESHLREDREWERDVEKPAGPAKRLDVQAREPTARDAQAVANERHDGVEMRRATAIVLQLPFDPVPPVPALDDLDVEIRASRGWLMSGAMMYCHLARWRMRFRFTQRWRGYRAVSKTTHR